MDNKKKKQFVLYSYQDYMNLFFFSPLTNDRVKELKLHPVYLSDNPEDKTLYYKYRFPILFWERKDGSRTPTLYCELTINAHYDNKVILNVVKPSEETYAYFYCTEVTNLNRFLHPMLICIHKAIHKELKRLGIGHKKELRGNKYDNRTGVQKTRRTKMGNSIPDKKIQRRKRSNKDS